MANYSSRKILDYFNQSDLAQVSAHKGKALEDLICYLFEKIPGISVTRRNQMNIHNTEEIDVAFWNEKNNGGLVFLPYIILVECKNWSSPVGSIDVSWFKEKVKHRAQDIGIFIAANGITGNQYDLTQSQSIISSALQEGIRLIVITRNEILNFRTTDCLIKIIKEKLCELVVSGSAFYEQ